MSAALESSLLANAADMQANMGVLSQATPAMFQSARCDVLSKAKCVCARVSTSIVRMYLGIYI